MGTSYQSGKALTRLMRVLCYDVCETWWTHCFASKPIVYQPFSRLLNLPKTSAYINLLEKHSPFISLRSRSSACFISFSCDLLTFFLLRRVDTNSICKNTKNSLLSRALINYMECKECYRSDDCRPQRWCSYETIKEEWVENDNVSVMIDQI